MKCKLKDLGQLPLSFIDVKRATNMAKRAGFSPLTPPNKLKPGVMKGSVFDRLHKGATAKRLSITTTQASHSRGTSDGDVVQRLDRRFDDCWGLGVIVAGTQAPHHSDLHKEPDCRKAVELVADARPKASTSLARCATSSRLIGKHLNPVNRIDLDNIEEERPKAQKNRPLVLSYSERFTKKTAFSQVASLKSLDHSNAMSAPLTPIFERSKKSKGIETSSATDLLIRRTLSPEDQRPHFRVNLRTHSLTVQSECDQERAKAMRERLATTYTTEVEEPPDLLDLNFMDRGRYWEPSKSSKLAPKAKLIAQAVLKECAFRPKVSLLSPMSTPKKAQPSKSLSYTVQHSKQMISKTAATLATTSKRPSLNEKELGLYKAGLHHKRRTKQLLTVTARYARR
jgi:hypothetical protein